MGKGRSSNKDKQKKKISIAKRLGIDTEETYKTLISFYKKLSTEKCIIDTLDFILDEISDTTMKYFFIIGLIEFTKKYYGSSDDFKYEW